MILKLKILKAPPGNELYEKIESQGRLSKQFAFAEGETNIVPVMNEKKLYDGFIELINNTRIKNFIFKKYFIFAPR